MTDPHETEDAGRPQERVLWRSLEERATGRPAAAPHLTGDVVAVNPDTLAPVSRRGFLSLLGSSVALGGLGSCTRQPREEILPFASTPEQVIPGQALYFATAYPFSTGALGLLVESHDGRPTKVEGNPLHPSSFGATDGFAQAAVLDLADPERSTTVTSRGRVSTWASAREALAPELEALRARGGAGLRILSRAVTSPTLARQRAALLAELPEARWHVWEPVHRDAERAGALLALGEDRVPWPRLDRAHVVLTLDAELFGDGPPSVRLAHDFAERRRVPDGLDPRAFQRNRLYAVQSRPTLAGAVADHRLTLAPTRIERLVRRVAALVGVDVQGASAPALEEHEERWIAAAARDLEQNRGQAVVVAGRPLSPSAHALVLAINERLGALGTTLELLEPAELAPADHGASIAALARDALAGDVALLVVLGGNPIYDAPADVDFATAYERVPLRVHLGLFVDETAERSHWHLPEAHFLEAWSDARSVGGTASIVQPLIEPLYGGLTEHEVVAVLAGLDATPYDLVRETWREAWGADSGGDGFERRWRAALHDGIAAFADEPPPAPALRPLAVDSPPLGEAGALELVLYPDGSLWDGRFANNAWLLELPSPLTKLSWDNAALVAPSTAERLGIESGDLVELRVDGRTVTAGAWVMPGVARDCVALSLGWGRLRIGAVGAGAGFDAYPLRSLATPWTATGLTVRRTGGEHEFATTQEHDSMEGRDIVREVELAAFRAGETGAPEHGIGAADVPADATMSPDAPPLEEGNQWGMVIDLDTCVGCSACVLACQSENNIPVVGKEEVDRGRAMHWLRIDRYWAGDADDPQTRFQPVPCMHCENAPCELVCPVNATVHGPDGLNQMIYNRCVGTRYCSNNCPYKVRRFNFYLYSDFETESLKLQRNPDVTVRSRGVMEKCTYCVQRISQARIAARKEGRSEIADGEVRTACQQVCPTQAITFGDVSDPSTAVSRRRALPHQYGLLAELNTRPRTRYLAKLTNPNEELDERGREEGR